MSYADLKVVVSIAHDEMKCSNVFYFICNLLFPELIGSVRRTGVL